MASANYLRGQARLLLQWAGDTKDSAQAERLRKRAGQLFILAEASDDKDKHLTFALGEFNAQQLDTSTFSRSSNSNSNSNNNQNQPSGSHKGEVLGRAGPIARSV